MTLTLSAWNVGIIALTQALIYLALQTAVKSGIGKAIDHSFQVKLEGQKASLKKSEAYFFQQLQAAGELRVLIRNIRPRRTHPDMDWGEAAEAMAYRLEEHQENIGKFLSRYETVLPEFIADEARLAESAASDGVFQFTYREGSIPPEPTNDAIRSAELMHNHLQTAIEKLQSHLNSQVSSTLL